MTGSVCLPTQNSGCHRHTPWRESLFLSTFHSSGLLLYPGWPGCFLSQALDICESSGLYPFQQWRGLLRPHLQDPCNSRGREKTALDVFPCGTIYYRQDMTMPFWYPWPEAGRGRHPATPDSSLRTCPTCCQKLLLGNTTFTLLQLNTSSIAILYIYITYYMLHFRTIDMEQETICLLSIRNEFLRDATSGQQRSLNCGETWQATE